MGEIADLVIEGVLCQVCGSFIDEEFGGHPRTCSDCKSSVMIWGITEIDGWFYVDRWGYYQRCEGRVVSYIERMYGFYRVHVTWRGELGFCDIEYRDESFDRALAKAAKLLATYNKSTDKKDLHKDYFSPHNPDGYWQTVYNR